ARAGCRRGVPRAGGADARDQDGAGRSARGRILHPARDPRPTPALHARGARRLVRRRALRGHLRARQGRARGRRVGHHRLDQRGEPLVPCRHRAERIVLGRAGGARAALFTAAGAPGRRHHLPRRPCGARSLPRRGRYKPRPSGAHGTDQLRMYRDLILAAPGLAEPDLARFFKAASIGAPAAPERVETPRPGVTVARDAFGVPHVTGATRGDVFFGAGWVTAEDRLFLADALRNMGRGRFTQFAGDLRDVLGAVGFDRTYAAVAGYSEEELELQINQGIERNPVLGQTVLDDATAFVAGVNAYIAEARADPTKAKLPAEYGLLHIPLQDWKLTDVVACTISFTT